MYCRSMLLWTSCIRQRDSNWDTEVRADFAIAAWVETRAIQDALDMHKCNSDTALIYMCREYIYKYVYLRDQLFNEEAEIIDTALV